MPKLSDDRLLQQAINDAIKDRDSFSDAYGRQGKESDEAVLFIASMKLLCGRSLKHLEENELRIARRTFIYAEQWRDSLAESQSRKTEIQYSKSLSEKYRRLRIARWGKTALEQRVSTATGTQLK